MNLRLAILLGALLGACGVGLGAYHAHGLEKRLLDSGIESATVEKRVEQGEVGVRYQLVHALGLMNIGILASLQKGKCLAAAGWCFVIGVLFFSGGLYMLSMGGPEPLRHPAIVPLGGGTLIIGWCLLLIHAAGIKSSTVQA